MFKTQITSFLRKPFSSASSCLMSFCFRLNLFLQTHSHTHTYSVGLPPARDRPVAETSTWQHKTFTTARYSYLRRDSNSRSWQVSGHRDRRPVPGSIWRNTFWD